MIDRELTPGILKWLDEDKILLIKGARQVGKTTLMFYLKEYLENKGFSVFYFSADQEVSNPIFKDPKKFIQFIKDQKKSDSKIYILLDEFQYIKNSGTFLKILFDSGHKDFQMIISGSSTLEIAKSTEFLTGRKIDFHLHTFSFYEYLNAKSDLKFNFQWKPDDKFSILKQFYEIYAEDLKRHFLDYIEFGGYPEIVLQNSIEKKELLLKNLVSTYLHRDIAGFLKIENIESFNALILILSDQIGSLMNYNKLSNIIDMDVRTIKKYTNALRHTFIFEFIPPYFSNIRKTIKKMKKIYVCDLGILKYAMKNLALDSYKLLKGEIVENFVFNELNRKFGNDKIHFYRTVGGKEIDFVISTFRGVYLVESKFRGQIKNANAYFQDFKKDSLRFVITRDLLKKEKEVIFIPVFLMPFIKMSE